MGDKDEKKPAAAVMPTGDDPRDPSTIPEGALCGAATAGGCEECTSLSKCGWCGGTGMPGDAAGRCVPGTRAGPTGSVTCPKPSGGSTAASAAAGIAVAPSQRIADRSSATTASKASGWLFGACPGGHRKRMEDATKRDAIQQQPTGTPGAAAAKRATDVNLKATAGSITGVGQTRGVRHAQICAEQTSCNSCSKVRGCGWCAATAAEDDGSGSGNDVAGRGTCMEGSDDSPDHDVCDADLWL